MGAFFFFFLMPQPAAAFFFWWLAGSRIIETSLGLVPVTGVPSAAQRCLSCATVRRMSDSSVSLICCGVIRCDIVAVVSRGCVGVLCTGGDGGVSRSELQLVLLQCTMWLLG